MDIQVFFMNEKTYKYYAIDGLDYLDGIINVVKQGEIIATLIRQNITQIVRIEG